MPTSTEEALRESLVNPFEVPGESHVSEWFNYLAAQFPLWTFQPVAYFEHQAKDVPRQYPIDVLAYSILSDDQMQPKALSPLEAAVMHRRQRLMGGLMQVETWSLEPVLRSDVTVYDWPNQIWTLSGGQYWGSIGLDAEYADVGRELMRLVDDVDRAVDADEREAPREALKQYQKEIAKRRRGSPRKGPRDELLRALASEGDQLLELLWLTLPSKISQRTDQLLATHKVARSDRNLWAFRLALPILSKPEIQALRDPSETGWTKRRGIKPSPTRLCTWILSRRLGMKPVSLARKTLGARASETFEGIANPVDAFTS